MAKNIVVCSDGTGNTSIKGRGTNVFKLFEAIDLNGHRFDPRLTPQIALYDDGVGTENFKPVKIFAGMTGYGLSRNVKQLYKEVVRVYDPGDNIYLFGFSRGAFTVRTLAGFIATCGMLDRTRLWSAKALESRVAQAYRVYRKCYRTKLLELVRGKPDGRESQAFREKNSIDCEVRIKFLGVWDTVDAVGLPFHLSDILNSVVYRFKFPDHRLSSIVDRACHALAIDDERHSFRPLLWDETQETGGRIEQVWFSGAHSNIGGGYPKQGMSLVSLDWMLEKAGQAGLRYNLGERVIYREHANVDDKLYNPRAGLGIFYRWKIRDVGALCDECGVQPKLHLSVLERIAHGTEDYVPCNLPPTASVAVTDPGRPDHKKLLEQRARNVEAVLQKEGVPLLASLKGATITGRLSYYTYLVTCTWVILAASGDTFVSPLAEPVTTLKNVGGLLGGLLTSPFETTFNVLQRIWASTRLFSSVVAGFAVAYVLALWTDRRTSAVSSQFWYRVQPMLRQGLKRARADVGRDLTTDQAEPSPQQEEPPVKVMAVGQMADPPEAGRLSQLIDDLPDAPGNRGER